MADDQSTPVLSRVRYFDGEFLQDADFSDEQRYHIDRRQRHNRLLHVAGIAEGLEIGIASGSVTVKAGTAVDSAGRQILLGADRILPIPASSTQELWLTIHFNEEEDRRTTANSNQATRYTQKPIVTIVDDLGAVPQSQRPVVLGKLILKPGETPLVTSEGRVYSGLRLPGPSGVGHTMRAKSDSPKDWAELSSSLSVQGSMRIDKDLHVGGKVGIGTTDPKTSLHLPLGGIQIGASTTAEDNFHVTSDKNGPRALRFYGGNYGAGSHLLTVTSSGNVGIGATDPMAKLDISGTLRATNGSNLNCVVVGKSSAEVAYEYDFETVGVLLPGNNLRLQSPNSIYFHTEGTVRMQVGKAKVWIWDDLYINRIAEIKGSLHVNEGSISCGITAGCSSAEVTYPYAYESVGVASKDHNLRLQSPNAIVLHSGLEPRVTIAKTGDVTIEGTIKGKTSLPLREQLVHRRVVFGIAGDTPVAYDYGGQYLGQGHQGIFYHPFGYATPIPQTGAKRRTRLYAVYSDDITTASGVSHVIFARAGGNENFYTFALGHTWGDSSIPRDGYSTWVEGELLKEHMSIRIRTTIGDTYGKIWYLEIQTWDFFD